MLTNAFGNITNKTGNADNPYTYCGEYTDKETGNIYLRARYYDPGVGRFLSQDPYWTPRNRIYGSEEDVQNPNINAIRQSVNLYAYCGNNPINKIDFLGLAEGDLQVNGNNIGYTSQWSTGVYGSSRDFVLAFGGAIIGKNNVYTAKVGNYEFTMDNNINNNETRNLYVYKNGKLVGESYYCKVDDGSGKGNSKLLINMQFMVDLMMKDGYSINLAYEAGRNGGVYTSKALTASYEITFIKSTEAKKHIKKSPLGSYIVSGFSLGEEPNVIGNVIVGALSKIIDDKQIQSLYETTAPYIGIYDYTYKYPYSKEVYYEPKNNNIIPCIGTNVGSYRSLN